VYDVNCYIVAMNKRLKNSSRKCFRSGNKLGALIIRQGIKGSRK